MKEEEIRNRNVFNKYLKLVEMDVKKYFDFGSFAEVNCLACSGCDFITEFEKLGFRYVSCRRCYTLFVNPRPLFDVLRRFYSKSSSTSFWVNDFFKPVAEIRREKIFRPRAEYVAEMLSVNKGLVIGDIGAGFGLFLKEVKKILPDNHYIAIEPSVEMAEICRDNGLETKCMYLEEMVSTANKFDFLSAFELIEHLFDPISFLNKTYSLLKSGGYLFLTTLNGRGFDISLLWEKSKAIFPPHHLNFFNPRSIEQLLEKAGFEIIEISTPGELDWDIVEGMIKNENLHIDRFWDLLAQEGNQTCKNELQDWITGNNLSSHMRVLARR